MKFFLFYIVIAFLLNNHKLDAQNKIITGKVINTETKVAIPGVSVVVKGTTVGTITNSEGVYNLEIPQNSETLIFSFLGMITQELPVSSNTIDAALKTDFIGIGEVVALGYTEKGKNEITGSSYQVKGSIIANVPVTSVDQALQGKVPGLVVSAPSGTPGTIQDIRIRGVGSITASNQPLFVIDGVPVINPDFSGEIFRSTFSALSVLNSDDIETITVLKDASATSAYGARGSNGVIVISTKKGGFGKTRFSFNTSVGFQNLQPKE